MVNWLFAEMIMLCIWEIQKEHRTITESDKINKDRPVTPHTEIYFLHDDQFIYLPSSSDLSESTGTTSCSQQTQQATLCGPYSVSALVSRTRHLALPRSSPLRVPHMHLHLPRTLLLQTSLSSLAPSVPSCPLCRSH